MPEESEGWRVGFTVCCCCCCCCKKKMNKSQRQETKESIIPRVIFALGLNKDCQENRVNRNTMKHKSVTVQRLL